MRLRLYLGFYIKSSLIAFNRNPFGQSMPGRTFVSEEYRYGYQGSEREAQLEGGSAYTTDYRMLDVRIGRWFSTDMVTQPWQSPFTSMDNSPIMLTDIMGLQTGGGSKGGGNDDFVLAPQSNNDNDGRYNFNPSVTGKTSLFSPLNISGFEIVQGMQLKQAKFTSENDGYKINSIIPALKDNLKPPANYGVSKLKQDVSESDNYKLLTNILNSAGTLHAAGGVIIRQSRNRVFLGTDNRIYMFKGDDVPVVIKSLDGHAVGIQRYSTPITKNGRSIFEGSNVYKLTSAYGNVGTVLNVGALLKDAYSVYNGVKGAWAELVTDAAGAIIGLYSVELGFIFSFAQLVPANENVIKQNIYRKSQEYKNRNNYNNWKIHQRMQSDPCPCYFKQR